MLQRHIPRFVPQAASPEEAYQRATLIPRDVRSLADTLLVWSLSNLRTDSQSALGDLTKRFGFNQPPDSQPTDFCLEIPLTPATDLRVRADHLVCIHPHGSTVLMADRFEPLHVRPDPTSSAYAVRPAEPIHWLLAWATISRSFKLLGRYERWVTEVITPRMRAAQAASRPRRARHSSIPVLELPQALDAMAEWCSDSEMAMMAWIISDARHRGVEPIIPRI